MLRTRVGDIIHCGVGGPPTRHRTLTINSRLWIPAKLTQIVNRALARDIMLSNHWMSVQMGKKLFIRSIALTVFLFIVITCSVDYNNCPTDFKDFQTGDGPELTTVCTDKDTYQLGETGYVRFSVKKVSGNKIRNLRFEESSPRIEMPTAESECGEVQVGETCTIESPFEVVSAPGSLKIIYFTIHFQYDGFWGWTTCSGHDPIPFPLKLEPSLPSGKDYCYEFTDYYFEDTISGNRATKYQITGKDHRICAEASGICMGCSTNKSCRIFIEGTSHKPDGSAVTDKFDEDERGQQVSEYWIDGNDNGTIKRCTSAKWGSKGKRTYEFKICDCEDTSCECALQPYAEYNGLGVLQSDVFVVSSDYEPDLELYVSPVTGAPSNTVPVKISVTNKKIGAEDVNFDNPAINVSIKWSLTDSADVISLGDILDGETKEASFQITLPDDVGNHALDLTVNYFDASGKKTTKPYPQDVSVKSCTGVSDCDQESCSVSKEICQDSKTILRTNICIYYDCVEGACIPIDKPPSESTEPCGTENFCSSGVCGPCSGKICGDKCYTESGKCCDSKKWYSGGECCSDGECISLKRRFDSL